jgi:Uma2 family endonuclease
MKAVMANVPDSLLEARRRSGADRWDEMWEGVLHMPPMPNRSHQDLEWAMETWLRQFWASKSGGKCYHQINVASVGGWPSNYRIPDLVLLTPDRFSIDKNEYFEGAPAVVVEIRSPGDETYEKFDFYAQLGVPELWVIDRQSCVPELYRLDAGRYEEIPVDDAGYRSSLITRVRLGHRAPDKLVVQLEDDPATRAELP